MTEILTFLDVTLNEAWLSVYKLCNGDEFTLNVTIPVVIMLTTYWVSSTFFAIVDMYSIPAWVMKFKIPDPNSAVHPRITPKKLRHIVRQVLFNQTLVAVPVIYLSYISRSLLGYDNGIRVPKPPRFILNIFVHLVMEEIFFYYSHRFLHHPLFYKKYHKKHHEWISPVGASAIYCHPVEHVLSNVVPVFAGSIVAGSHVTTLWIWLTFGTPYGVFVHSGYHLPFAPTPEFHHYHHQKFNENFGIAGVLDWLHGTDKNFRKSQAYTRDKVIFNLTPLK